MRKNEDEEADDDDEEGATAEQAESQSEASSNTEQGGPLLRLLYDVLKKPILDMPAFNQEQRLKELAAANKKNKFKGQKCESKPTSMDIHITIKNLELETNYFDQSKKIIEEK